MARKWANREDIRPRNGFCLSLIGDALVIGGKARLASASPADM
jgi:hypothetical protein